ncbi:thioredoxin domain-containing protein 12-like [Branchiostoma floridae]|uniref:Thioredoxin domain-containing protein 12 n=1 Tax=Branchiostoma floridae TaxID=7739 RepID=A0A9J7MDM7_BRAFL|nr:thioredoxin domain-containing protein 12-like [Branchiostoma floridae]
MASSLIVSLAVLGCLSVLGCAGDDQNKGRGFGDNFAWKDFQSGLQEAKETKKPLLLLIHKSWCGACKALKPKFAASKQIQDLSKHFVMVNVEDDEEPHGEEYTPDGGYIPRILFMDPEGKVRRDIVNINGNPSYRYYYPDPIQVVDSMKLALEKIAPDTLNAQHPDEL